MSTFFEGSVVLAQNSGGHGVTAVQSNCTLGYIQTYLDTGKMPKAGTVCQTSKKPLVDTVIAKRDLAAPIMHVARRWL
jgi:hypothetical protein